MRKYRVIELKYPYGMWNFQIQRRDMFGRWRDCNDSDVTHMYATLEEAKSVIDKWQNGNIKKVVFISDEFMGKILNDRRY